MEISNQEENTHQEIKKKRHHHHHHHHHRHHHNRRKRLPHSVQLHKRKAKEEHNGSARKKRSRTRSPVVPCEQVKPLVFVDTTYSHERDISDGTDPLQRNTYVPSSDLTNDYVSLIQTKYPDLNIPNDITPVTLATEDDNEIRKHIFSDTTEEVLRDFHVFESSEVVGSGGGVEEEQECNPEPEENTTAQKSNSNRQYNKGKKKRVSTAQDKVYRSDREYVKRHSHKKMIWFFRKLGLRHPAAIRTHLEKVKHPEFELPNLQCVVPHAGNTVAFDEQEDATNNHNHNGNGWANRNDGNMTFYQIYCATDTLVERVKNLMGGREKHQDANYNKRVLTFIADIVGRLLWHSNRTHTVMFAKSDHYERECFLLYSRQAEMTPFMMRSDKYFCRRHDSEKFKHLAPQPDLTRANSTRLSNESSIYVVGCNVIELWETFPYEYRLTQCRQMKALYDRVKQIDPSVLEHAFSSINAYVNGGRVRSPYVEVASKTSFDALSVLLRDGDLKENTADDSAAYKDFMERFITAGVLNVHSMLKYLFETKHFGGYRDTISWQPSSTRLDQIVLHHVHHRREIRELRTNRVYYYRNANNFICSLSLLDDMFDEQIQVQDVGEEGEKNHNVVHFYDILLPFEYDEEEDVNALVLQTFDEVQTMIQESSHTIGQHLTAKILRGQIPEDPFYPGSTMSPVDLAIDRMLERAIKHSKKLQLLTPSLIKSCGARGSVPLSSKEKDVIVNSLSKNGENRLQDGYLSPSRPDFVMDHHVEHNGQQFHLKITANGAEPTRKLTKADYGSPPGICVDRKLLCVYVIDPSDECQVRILPGSQIIDSKRPDFLRLKITDRIVRVFTVQAVNELYAIRPKVYFIFRNTPTCSVTNEVINKIYDEVMASFEDYSATGVFNEFDQSLNNTNGLYIDQHQRQQSHVPNNTTFGGHSTTSPVFDQYNGDQTRLESEIPQPTHITCNQTPQLGLEDLLWTDEFILPC